MENTTDANLDYYIDLSAREELYSRKPTIRKDYRDISLGHNEVLINIVNRSVMIEKDTSEGVALHRISHFKKFTEYLLQRYSMDVSFRVILNIEDIPPDEDNCEYSKFAFARRHKSNNVLVPDCYISLFPSRIEVVNKYDIPFTEKVNKAIFIGADTGHQRIPFCHRYKESKVVFAKISSFIQNPSEKDEAILSPPLSIETQLKYRYLININGNSTSWDRLIWILNSNSICLFIIPPEELMSWYYHIFHQTLPFFYVKENEVEAFIETADEQSLLSHVEKQKALGKMLANIYTHELYLLTILHNFNALYNA